MITSFNARKIYDVDTNVDTLLARLSAARALLLDNLSNLDATVSSRAAAATALTNATWTDARAAALDGLKVIDKSLMKLEFLHCASNNSTVTDTYTVTAGKVATVYNISFNVQDSSEHTVSLVIAGTTYISESPGQGGGTFHNALNFSWGGGFIQLTAGQTIVIGSSSGSVGVRAVSAGISLIEEDA